jgi:hypothetical protein
MKRFLKIGLASLAVFFIMSPASAYAVDVFDDVCNKPGSQDSPACQSDQDPITGSEGIISRVTSIIALVAGIIAVIVIIIGGFMYVTAGGDSGKTKTARDTIIYAAVGLVVIALAQSIIMFIINRL